MIHPTLRMSGLLFKYRVFRGVISPAYMGCLSAAAVANILFIAVFAHGGPILALAESVPVGIPRQEM